MNCSELRSDQKLHPAENTAPCTAATKPNVILTEVCNAIMCHAEWVTEEWSAVSRFVVVIYFVVDIVTKLYKI